MTTIPDQSRQTATVISEAARRTVPGLDNNHNNPITNEGHLADHLAGRLIVIDVISFRGASTNEKPGKLRLMIALSPVPSIPDNNDNKVTKGRGPGHSGPVVIVVIDVIGPPFEEDAIFAMEQELCQHC
jgi:hypothetical protein